MKIKFAIGIPTLNRVDLLLPSLEKYLFDFRGVKIHIVDNGNQKELDAIKSDYVIVHRQEKNIGVAGSWNYLLKEIFKDNDYAIILNDDIYLGKNSYSIENFLERNPTQKLYTNPLDWCVFILPKTTFEMLGEFDEQFYPAYCEDNDYVYRLKLKGFKVYKTPELLPMLHRASMTLEKDYTLQDAFHNNKIKYIEKWGGAPDFEIYKKPYNKK